MNKFFTTALVLTILQYSSNAQELMVKGRVVDESNLPIQNAIIKLLVNDSLGVIKYYSLSKSDGEFEFITKRIDGKLILQISSIGYVNYVQDFSISNVSEKKTYVLKKFIGDLPAVKVVANKNITRKGDTTTFKVSAFETGSENNLAELLRKLPGLIVDDKGKVSFNGKKISRILLEEDDLFGSNYATLTNNSGISGIEEIDVIENYKDNSRLENTIEFGNETVLNLRYKKKKIRLFGNISVANGLPLNYTEQKTNITGIISKHKFIINLNKNSTGTLSSKIFGSETEMQLLNNENDKIPYTLNLYNSPINFNAIKPLNIKDDRLFSNNSYLISANHLFKANKKLSFKTITNVLFDDYSHANTSIQKINTPLTPLSIVQNNLTAKVNQLTNMQMELNWRPSNMFQTILQYSCNNLNNAQYRNGYLVSKYVGQNLNQNTIQNRGNLSIIKVFKKGGILSGNFFYNQFKLSYGYTIENPLFDTSFQLAHYYNYLQQSVVSMSSILAAQLKYVVKRDGYLLTFLFQSSSEKSNLKITTNAFNSIDSLNALASNYNKDFFSILAKQVLSINISKKYTNKLLITSSVQLLNSQIKLQNQELQNITKDINFFVIPSTNLQYQISSKKIFLFNFQLQPFFPLIQQLNTSSVFTDVNSITKGIDKLNINSGYNFSSGYLFFDALNSGIIFNAFGFLSNIPPNYLANVRSNGIYVFNELQAFNKKNNFITLSTRLEKTFFKIKSSLVTSINLTRSSSYFSSINQLTTNRGNILQVETKYRTNWKKWFNATSSILFRYQNQTSFVQQQKTAKFINNDLLVSSLISLRLLKKYFIDIQNDYLINKSNGAITKDLWFTDVSIKYNISKTLSGGLIFKNLFNQKSFISNEISSTQTVFNTFNLLPFFCLLNIQYKF